MSSDTMTIDSPRSLVVAVWLSAVAVLIFNALPVILGVMADSLNFSDEQLGLLASAELAGIGLTSLSGLFWVNRVNWRPLMLFACLVLVGGNLLSAFLVDFQAMIVARSIIGLLGEGIIFTVSIAAIGDSKRPDQAFAYSIVGQVGMGMVALWTFPYIAQCWGYTGVMVTLAMVALSSVAMLQWLPAASRKGEKLDADGKVPAIGLASVTPLIGLSVIVFWSVGMGGIWAFLDRIGDSLSLPATTIGELLSISLGLGALASLFVALIGDKYGRFWPPVVTLILHGAMSLVLTGELNVYVYSVLILLLTFVWNIGLPYLLGMIADGDVSGRLIVLVVAAQAGGTAAGPLIAGQVVELKGLENLGYFSALFCGLALFVLLVFLTRFKKLAIHSNADRKTLSGIPPS